MAPLQVQLQFMFPAWKTEWIGYVLDELLG